MIIQKEHQQMSHEKTLLLSTILDLVNRDPYNGLYGLL